MTKTGEAAQPPAQLDADSLLETIRLKQREIAIGAIAIAAVAVIGWFWRSSVVQKDERAERALNLAANSYYSGNKALAKTDLEKMVARFGGTPGGIQGAMLLAQILYEEGQYEPGIKQLEAVRTSAGGGPFAASVEGLVAAGYADQNKFDEAAKRYLAAADKAAFPADKDLYRADAARVFALAGKKEEARKIWAEIVTRIDSPALGEAKIRLGELSAAPIAKN
jgi:predicted negative regulator of RcsB-dependent stress response